MSTGNSDAGIATVRLDAEQSPRDADAIRRAVAAGGPTFLPRHRWFGDKTRAIVDTSMESVVFTAPSDDAPYPLAMTVIEVGFRDGGRERYFVPLTLDPGGSVSEYSLARIEGQPNEVLVLNDAIDQPAFHRWLLAPTVASHHALGSSGRVVWRPGPGFGAARRRLGAVSSRVSKAEQSNSAVIFGGDLLAKVFRKLRPGLNPDIEISRYLSAQSGFRNFPELLGDLTFETGQGSSYSIGMLLPFVPNVGDGWAYTLSLLEDMLLGGTAADPVDPFRGLGVRTAELHRALAGPTDDPAFAPQAITSDDVQAWTTALETSLAQTLGALRSRGDQLPLPWRQRLANLSLSSPAIVHRLQGFRQLEGFDKIRVHGDYHLGQVLGTQDLDFVILDFEGEPSRPMAERRAKTSPLKDVAGMLRSFSYARFAALRARPVDVPEQDAAARLRRWEHEARSAFLDGYRSVPTDRGANPLPEDEAVFMAALSAWTLDKAIYEVNYELNNRPDWLPLPLEALLTADS